MRYQWEKFTNLKKNIFYIFYSQCKTSARTLNLSDSFSSQVFTHLRILTLRAKFNGLLLLLQVEFIEAYCTPRDTARRSPLRSRRSREPRRSPDSSKWRYDSRRGYDFDSSRRPYDYDSRRYYGDSGRRAEFDAESARRRADYESARRTDFDLSAPGVSRRSPESAPEGSADSPPEPAPSAPLRHERQPRHRSQQYYESGKFLTLNFEDTFINGHQSKSSHDFSMQAALYITSV